MSQPSADTSSSAAKGKDSEQKASSIEYNVGDYVELQGSKKNTTRKGYIRFKGKIDAFGDCVGIELDEKIADGNDGKFNEKEYFECAQGKGTFIKTGKIIQKLGSPPQPIKTGDSQQDSKEPADADNESFPALVDNIIDKGEEQQIKKPRKKKNKTDKNADSKSSTKSKGKSSSRLAAKDRDKKSSSSSNLNVKGRKTGSRSPSSPSNSRSKSSLSSSSSKKSASKKKEANYEIPSSGSIRDKLKFVYSKIGATKAPFKKRAELMKKSVPIIEDEKCDAATAKYAVEGYKKCFVAQLSDKKKSVHIAACELLNAMITTHTKQFKVHTAHYLKYLMQLLERSDSKSTSAAEASIHLIMEKLAEKDNKQLGVVVAEFIRFGSSAKNKSVRKHGWQFLAEILVKYEPKKGQKAKKPPKAILDAVQTGLKQGLADADKATQGEAMRCLKTISSIDEARGERISSKLSPAAKRNFDQLVGNKHAKNRSAITLPTTPTPKKHKSKTKTPKTPSRSVKSPRSATKERESKKSAKAKSASAKSRTPNGSTKLGRNNSKTTSTGSKKSGKTAGAGKSTPDKGKKVKTGGKTKTGKKSGSQKDLHADDDSKSNDETAPDRTAGDVSKTKKGGEESKPVAAESAKGKVESDQKAAGQAKEKAVAGDATETASTADSSSSIQESTTSEAAVEAKDDQDEEASVKSKSSDRSEEVESVEQTKEKQPQPEADEEAAVSITTTEDEEDKPSTEGDRVTEETPLSPKEDADGDGDGDEDNNDDEEDDDDDDDDDDDESSDEDGDEDIINSSENDARDLIESFLDLKDPQINWKMIEFLSKDNMTHLLMSYISRMPQGPKIWQENLDVDMEEVIPPTLPLYSAESDEIRATQLSYSLMRILSNEHAAETVKSFLLRKCQEICLHALAVFHPLSKGNVYHGRVVLEILLNHWPKSFMAALANQRHIQSLLKCALFRNLHQGNLNSFFLDLICFRPNQKIGQIQPVKKKLMKMFVDWKFMEYLLSASCEAKHGDDVATKYSTFFIDMVARCASIQEAGELFKGHEHLVIDSFMNGLLDKDSTRTVWHRICCGQTLVQFLDISSRPTIMDPTAAMAGMLGVVAPDPNPNVLHPMFEDSLKRLHEYIPQMCAAITDKSVVLKPVKLASGEVEKPFGQVRLNCLELLTVSADFAQFKCGHVLGLLKVEFWEELLNMAFTHNQNNMYLCHFRRLIHLSMIFRRRFLKHLFVHCQMLERFVDFYENKPKPRTTLHGYILQMLWDIYNHDQRDDEEEDENKNDNNEENEEEEEEEEQRDSVVINEVPEDILNAADGDDAENADNNDSEDNAAEKEKANESEEAEKKEEEDEFGDDVVLKPNFSKEPEDQWDIVAFFHASEVWKAFTPTVTLQMEAQNATEPQVPNMNVANNQQQLDQLLQNLLGPSEDPESSDSDSDSDED
mmetsp:Transcript_2577/g.4178  ORF Transcript_2577/g.4178 Transcript_2577/m.4178 type:complete len:1436 (+) Transcript_2577:119-4426(+)